MTEKEKVTKSGASPDWFMRGALTKIGDTLDAITGRRWVASSTLATSELVERMKRLMDSEAKEVEGKGIVVPHNIKLKMQWDKFSTDSEKALENLRDELLAAAADHINDSLYYTYAPLHVEVKPDYFTEGVKLYVGFDKFSDDETDREMNVTITGVQLRPADIPKEIATPTVV
ncbi:MAG: FhaA domain-containing protein, partial [Pyrinomonadaceae bacterium]